jgi:hypothetical protein
VPARAAFNVPERSVAFTERSHHGDHQSLEPMWPASEINASEEAMMPTTTSTAMNAKISAKAPARYREFRGPAAESLWPPGPW